MSNCDCGNCGSCCASMAASNPNPSICQSPCCSTGDGGAGTLSSVINAVGKWGSVLTAQAQGRAVAVNPNGVVVGAKGSQTLPGKLSSNTLILILIVAGALIFLATRGN